MLLDDVLVYKINNTKFQMVVNASNKEKIESWINKQNLEGVDFNFPHDEFSILALQGPKAKDIVVKLFGGLEIENLKTYWGITVVHSDLGEFYVSRTGYTGEDGFEFSLNKEQAQKVWALFMENEVVPAGLGCRDTLRLEAGYSLYGHELSEEIDPITAGLGWICPKTKESYVGFEAIKEIRAKGVAQKVVGIELLEKAIPRQGCEMVHEGNVVGVVTSGSQSPTLNKFIGMAYVNTEFATLDSEINLDIRGRLKKAKIVSRRFYVKAK
jgi:aminomethyltransferase